VSGGFGSGAVLVVLVNLLPLAGWLYGRWTLRGWPALLRRYRRTAGLAVALHGLQVFGGLALGWRWMPAGGGPTGAGLAVALQHTTCCMSFLAPVLGIACAIAPAILRGRPVPGRCLRCGYRLASGARRCPECGHEDRDDEDPRGRPGREP